MKKTSLFAFALPLSIALCLPYPAQARQNNSTEQVIADTLRYVFSDRERDIIKSYYDISTPDTKKGRKGLPPGLAKKNKLPPGLQKQINKNGQLPPGLAKNDLPFSLNKKLYPPKYGTQRYIVGSDIILMDIATQTILDVMRDVVTR